MSSLPHLQPDHRRQALALGITLLALPGLVWCLLSLCAALTRAFLGM